MKASARTKVRGEEEEGMRARKTTIMGAMRGVIVETIVEAIVEATIRKKGEKSICTHRPLEQHAANDIKGLFIYLSFCQD